ncbi:hypothetical protein DESA109040_13800 [Deinococcus saxicola]|uniref:hypothetical protein n=1 Tax=Deinococcus saxicola TaxID=249406 RepID=UPI0039EE7DCF
MLHEVPAVRPQIARAYAEKCRHCGRPLTHPGTVIPFVGVVGPECRSKFMHLIALVAEVEMLSFNIDDQGSQRLAHMIWSRLINLGFLVTKHADTVKRTLWLEVDSRKVSRRGAEIVKRWETVRAEFEQQLKLAQAEREGAAA